jgi:hypothetical protein
MTSENFSLLGIILDSYGVVPGVTLESMIQIFCYSVISKSKFRTCSQCKLSLMQVFQHLGTFESDCPKIW